MRVARDAVGVAEQRAGERERGPALADTAGPVEEVRVRGALGERGARRRFASSCSGKVSKVSMDVLGEASGFSVPSTTRRAARRSPRSGGRRGRPLRRTRRPRSRCGPARNRGAARRPRRDDEEEGAVRQEARRDGEIDLEHALDSEPARDALVGKGRVDVAVADDVRAARQGGADHLVDELRARCAEERRLGPGRQPVAVRAGARGSAPRPPFLRAPVCR